MDMGLFLYSSVLIVELINYLQNQPFLVKIVQKLFLANDFLWQYNYIYLSIYFYGGLFAMQRFLSYENTILAVVMMVSFINPFTSSALTTALPSIGTAYGATDAQLSWVIELFLISSTVTIMPISKIADRIGKRHIFLFGVSLFCVSSLAVYFVNSLYGLFLLRILQGLGSASIFATSMAIVSLVTPPQRRGGPWALRLPPYIAACPLGLSWAASFLIT